MNRQRAARRRTPAKARAQSRWLRGKALSELRRRAEAAGTKKQRKAARRRSAPGRARARPLLKADVQQKVSLDRLRQARGKGQMLQCPRGGTAATDASD